MLWIVLSLVSVTVIFVSILVEHWPHWYIRLRLNILCDSALEVRTVITPIFLGESWDTDRLRNLPQVFILSKNMIRYEKSHVTPGPQLSKQVSLISPSQQDKSYEMFPPVDWPLCGMETMVANHPWSCWWQCAINLCACKSQTWPWLVLSP